MYERKNYINWDMFIASLYMLRKCNVKIRSYSLKDMDISLIKKALDEDRDLYPIDKIKKLERIK